jgi:hypothetical protein
MAGFGFCTLEVHRAQLTGLTLSIAIIGMVSHSVDFRSHVITIPRDAKESFAGTSPAPMPSQPRSERVLTVAGRRRRSKEKRARSRKAIADGAMSNASGTSGLPVTAAASRNSSSSPGVAVQLCPSAETL